jgi:hypothetical protein
MVWHDVIKVSHEIMITFFFCEIFKLLVWNIMHEFMNLVLFHLMTKLILQILKPSTWKKEI